MKNLGIVDRATDLIGSNPMIRLPVKDRRYDLLLKMEKFNPGGSMKDRMARSMIDAAEKNGTLKPGGVIIESTSGNTGVGVAMIAAERGYRFIAIVDGHAAKEKILSMKAYGAEIRHVGGGKTEDQVAIDERERYAKELSKEVPNAIFLGQADNPANAEGYYQTLGPEIFEQTKREIRVLIGAAGTGGSLSGTARFLRERNAGLVVVGVEPHGSVIFGPPDVPYYQSGTGNPGSVSVGKNVDYSLITMGKKVSDKEAFNTSRFLARRLGILIGGAAGGVVFVALQMMSEMSLPGRLVAIVADGGEKYLDTVFNDEWMKERSLIDPAVDTRLECFLTLQKYDRT